MNTSLSHFPQKEAFSLADQISYIPKQINKSMLYDAPNLRMLLMAFDQGEALGTHTTRGEVLIHLLEGAGTVIIEDEPHHLTAGESIMMPSGTPHAVQAEQPFKMLLQVFFPIQES